MSIPLIWKQNSYNVHSNTFLSDGVAPPLIRPTSKCRLVKPKAPPNRLSNALFIRSWHIAGIATNILHRVDIETKKEHNPLILLVAPTGIEPVTAP